MESTHCFGEFDHLVGVYSESNLPTTHPTAVIMLTPGMLHHVGAMGMHVQMARRLAAKGVASFRFDLSGIGESLAVASQGTSLERAKQEVAAAMDWLHATHGFQRFILFGLCSGADDALATAVQDHRVVGLSLMDGCGYRTHKFYLNWFRLKYLPKLLSTKKWQQSLRTWSHRRTAVHSMPMGTDIREYPAREETERLLSDLLNRGLHMQFIYTGGVIDYYSYAEQFYDMFPTLPRNEQIAVEHMPQCDHLFTLQTDRELLFDKLSHWLAKTAAAGAPAVEVQRQDELELVAC